MNLLRPTRLRQSSLLLFNVNVKFYRLISVFIFSLKGIKPSHVRLLLDKYNCSCCNSNQFLIDLPNSDIHWSPIYWLFKFKTNSTTFYSFWNELHNICIPFLPSCSCCRFSSIFLIFFSKSISSNWLLMEM